MKRFGNLLLAATLLLSACTSMAGGKSATYSIPLTPKYWTTQYDGYGSVTYSQNAILLYPMSATRPDETHAALTLANVAPQRDFVLTVNVMTEVQLRQNSAPNPWEVFWLLFNYTPTATGKNTNYFILKTNGVELGTATEQVAQTFLQTAPTSIPAIGQLNTMQVRKQGTHVTVHINGTKVIDYTGAVIDAAGSIGLYTEDAGVKVTGVTLTPL